MIFIVSFMSQLFINLLNLSHRNVVKSYVDVIMNKAMSELDDKGNLNPDSEQFAKLKLLESTVTAAFSQQPLIGILESLQTSSKNVESAKPRQR